MKLPAETVRWAILTLVLAASCAQGSGTVPADGGPGGPGTPPSSEPPRVPGLLGAVAASTEVRLNWILPASPLEAALFHGPTRAVYGGSPAISPLSGEGASVTSLANDQDRYFGMAVREPGGAWKPSGAVLQARPGIPIFVDASANTVGADGTSPQTAFPTLLQGLLTAFAGGGANVHVRGGDYSEPALPLFAGVHVFGGFDATFSLAARDTDANPVRLLSSSASSGIDVRGGSPPAVIDGLTVVDTGALRIGVDVLDTSVELRDVHISGMRDRGIRVRNSSASGEKDLRLIGCSSVSNAADGLSAAGPLDVLLCGSSFDGNTQEGVELDDLIALEGETARLEVLGSRFDDNGAEGMDIDLAAPPIPGPGGGRFDVLIRGAEFARNVGDGLLLDEDYELTPGWDGTIALVGCRAFANGAAGVHVDADASSDVFIHRCVVSANASDGLWISSESETGIAVVSALASLGNNGAGIRASLGQKSVALSHGLVAGNGGGGFVSSHIESSSASSVSYLQQAPWAGVRLGGTVDIASGSPPAFAAAPLEWRRVVSAQGNNILLDSVSMSALPGLIAEMGESETGLAVTSVQGSTLTLEEAPVITNLPVGVSIHQTATSLVEDWSLLPGSVAAGSGIGTPPRDAGPMGSPAAGPLGRAAELPAEYFRVAGITPPIGTAPGQTQPIEVRFDRPVDGMSLNGASVRAITDSGTSLSIATQPMGSAVRIFPPPSGWGAEPFGVRILDSLVATDGTPLTAPVVLPVDP